MTQLPPGFVMDGQPQQPQAAVQSMPALPPGFVVDQPDVLMDVAKSGGIGVAKGGIGLAGTGGDLYNLAQDAGQWLLGKATSPEFAQNMRERTAPAADLLRKAIPAINGPTSAEIQKGIEGYTGEFYKPQTQAGKYAQTVGEFAPAALLGPGNIARRMVGQALLPGIASETAGQLTEGTKYEPWARVGGALAAPAVAAAGRRMITPAPTNATHAGMVQALENEGVTSLTAGQRTNSGPLKWAESSLGDISGAATARTERAAEQFTAATLRRAGETADRATQPVIDGAFRRIGQQFDDLAARNSLQGDGILGNNLSRVERDYQSLVNPSQRSPIVADTIRDIGDAIANNRGMLQGDAYQALRSRLDRIQRGTNDNQLGEALRGIRNALDDAMERTIAVTNQPDLGAWRQARREYRNMLVIEKAATGPGSDTAKGLISPSALRNATVQQDRRAYARGRGDFAELARAGEAVMKPLPQSGTAPRAFFQSIPAVATTALGALAGGAPGLAFGAAAGLAGPPLAGRALMSNVGQRYFSNQMMAPMQQTPLSRALLANAALVSQPR